MAQRRAHKFGDMFDGLLAFGKQRLVGLEDMTNEEQLTEFEQPAPRRGPTWASMLAWCFFKGLLWPVFLFIEWF